MSLAINLYRMIKNGFIVADRLLISLSQRTIPIQSCCLTKCSRLRWVLLMKSGRKSTHISNFLNDCRLGSSVGSEGSGKLEERVDLMRV